MRRQKSIMEMLNDINKPIKRKKRVKLTPAQRIFIWEHPKLYGRKCSICHGKITKMSDLELDHTKSFKSGGKKQALAHKHCNRMKASGSLGKIQRELGLKRKSTKKKSKRVNRRRKPKSIWDTPKLKLP